jgi:tetratricopeptide (TPR) repeat protein
MPRISGLIDGSLQQAASSASGEAVFFLSPRPLDCNHDESRNQSMNPEEIQEIYPQLQKLAQKLQQAGADLPAGLDALLQGAGFPAGVPFDESQKLASASVAHLEPTVQSAAPWQSYLDDLVSQRVALVEDEFTVAPTYRGGQVAGKGFEFQDIYTIFLMTRFLDENAPAVLIRIEGAEDVDLLTRQDGNTYEWYYQVKTIKEGTNWTLRMFDTEGVWWRFAHCVSEFHAKCSDPTRSIRVVLVVDGDVGDDVQALRDAPQTFSITGRADETDLAGDRILTKVRGEALFSIARRYLRAHYADRQVREALRSRSTEGAEQLGELCKALAHVIDNEFITNPREPEKEDVADIITKLVRLPVQIADSDSDSNWQSDLHALTAELVYSLPSIAPSPDHLDGLRVCLTKAYLSLDPLFTSLQIKSRIGFTTRTTLTEGPESEAEIQDQFLVDTGEITFTQPRWHSYLEDAILLRLVEGTYLSTGQARIIYHRLKGFVRQAAQTGELINRSRFFLIISSVPRIQLEEIPDIDGLIPRPDLVSEIIKKLNSQPIEYLYGFPKIGKTKLAAMVASELSDTYSVFWHTIEAGADCTDRLVNDFTYFVGDLTGSRNLYVDWFEGKQSLSAIAKAATVALTGRSVLIVLDNCHVLDNGQIQAVSDLLQALISIPDANVKVLMVGEDRPGLPLFVSADASMRVGGLSFQESIELLKANDCFVIQDNLPGFLSLHSKTDGHPMMLLIAARQLEKVPSAQEVSALADSLPDLNQDTAQFFDRLAHQIFDVLTTAEQKEMLRRLSVLLFGFDRDLCFALAKCEPALDFKASDWRRLAAQVLDRSYRGKFVVPKIFKQIASEDVRPDLERRLYEAAADHIIDCATKERRVDFWDFQDAIFYLGFAGRWEDAARYFLGSLSANPSAPYEQLRLLYMVFRGPAFQVSDVDPALRSALAFSEFSKIVGDASVSDTSGTMLEVLKRMRSAILSIKDDKLRAVYSGMYYLATSSLYDQLLANQLAEATGYSTLRRESPTVAACSKRSLRRARKAFSYALLTEEPELVQSAFWAILHVNDSAIVPSPEEVPKFVDKVLRDHVNLDELTLPKQWGPIDFWDAISDTYLRYAPNHPDPNSALSVLAEHLEFARDRRLTRLEVIILHAIAYWHFERSKEYKRAIAICDENISTAEQLGDSAKLLKKVYTLRADSAYALKDYKNARADYTQAAHFFPSSGSLSALDVIIQYCVGDCYWHLGDYRAAASAYLKALKMRGRARGYDHANSFQLFGKLSLAYLCMGFYWNAVRLHEKMFSIYERFQDGTMFMRVSGSLQALLVGVQGSRLNELDAMYRGQFARPKDIGPEFYDAPIKTEGLQAWLDRTSLAGFRFLLAQAYDMVGDTINAILQVEASLHTEHASSYIPGPILRSLTYDLLSELYRKNGERVASAWAAFESMALTEDFLASQPFPRALESEFLTEEYIAEAETVGEMFRETVPSRYAQNIFRHYIEPVILEELNRVRRLDEQATYFLTLVDMASELPPSVRPCIEAWTQLYLGLFYLTRGYRQESTIAFTRMDDLVSEYDLLDVELVYVLHTTFGVAPLLYPSADDLTDACVKTALRLIDRLPDSRHWLGEYNGQLTRMWCSKITLLPNDPLIETRNRASERLQDLANKISDVEVRFFHVCAVLLLWIQEANLWSDNARILQREVLSRPLDQLETDDLFKLYDGFGSFARKEAQRHILGGDVERGQELSKTLYDAMSLAIESHREKLSSEQLAALQDHQSIAKLWSV